MSAATARERLDAMFVPGSDADAEEFARRVNAVVNEALGGLAPCEPGEAPDGS